MPILALLVVTAGLYVFFVEPLWMVPALEKMTPNILYRVETKGRLVALSFDDGPNARFTPQVLDLLKQNDAKATFFLIGERAEQNPELVRRILAEGNEVGNHWWRDGGVLFQSEKEFVKGFERTESVIESAALESKGGEKELTQRAQREEHREHGEKQPKSDIGDRSTVDTVCINRAASSRRTSNGLRFFRPPGGVARPGQLRLARQRGYTSVLGCAYPHDPMKTPEWYQQWLIEKNLAPGTIVILHDGIKDPTRSIETLRHVLAEGKRRGFKFVSIGELLDEGAREPR